MTKSRGVRLGLRREVLILLPAALMLLILLSTFSLLFFRNGLSLEAEQRRRQVARQAQVLADQVLDRPSITTPELLSVAEPAVGLALLDGEGWPVMSSGELPAGNLLPEDARTDSLLGAAGFGPSDEVGDVVAGVVALPPPSPAAYLRVDVPAAVLASQQRGLRVLTVVVISANAAVLILVLLFLRHLLAPWEALLEQARRAHPSGAGEDGESEVEMLLSTFEQAMDALARASDARPDRTTEDELAALQRTLAPSLESGLLLVDDELRVLAVNAVGQGLLDVAEPSAPVPAGELLAAHPSLLAVLEEAVREEGGIRRREVALAPAASGPEQGPRTLGLTVHPLRRDDLRVRGYMVLFADLTEARRKTRETELAQGMERLGEMAAGIAHELRNSLATLKGYLTLIERKPDEEQIADYLAEIRHEADHLQRVLEDFLTFSRPGSVRPEEISVAALARRAVADPALGEAEVQLTVEGEESVNLVADRQLLERAVRNLLLNAVRAQQEAGSESPVEVRLVGDESGVRLTIEDRGPGLPEALKERLFQPFASQFRGGVGLGLAVTHRIVVLHGGRIRLEDRPGGGARAELFFPHGTSVTKGNEGPWLGASEEISGGGSK
ncbi:MAG: ATP-binding protein [Acidobacteriota bacterium]|nr:ATP-binding protein [Acidobacteriota bacterium]